MSLANYKDRLDEFRNLKAGWCDGHGDPITEIAIESAKRIIEDFTEFRTYPTPEGGISIEFMFGDYMFSAETFKDGSPAYAHGVNPVTGQIVDFFLK